MATPSPSLAVTADPNSPGIFVGGVDDHAADHRGAPGDVQDVTGAHALTRAERHDNTAAGPTRGQHIAGLVEQAALAQALGKDLSHGRDQAWGPIGGDQQWRPQATFHHVSQKPKPVLVGATGYPQKQAPEVCFSSAAIIDRRSHLKPVQ